MAGGVERDGASQRPPDAGKLGGDQRPRVLCVDDEPAMLVILTRALEASFDVTTVDNPVAALAVLARDRNFSVVICDLKMPQMDGADFLSRVKSIAPACTRLAFTACLERHLRPDEVFGILTKPCPLKLLHETVAAAVQHHSLMARSPAADSSERPRVFGLPPPELDAAILQGDFNREDGISTFAILASVAEKLFAMRQASEAERILQPPLEDLLGRCERGQRPSPKDSDMAMKLAIRLAELNRPAQWIDYIFRLSTAVQRGLPSGVIERLYELMRQMPGAVLGGFRDYLPVLRACQNHLSPTEQLVIDRIEGLEPLMLP